MSNKSTTNQAIFSMPRLCQSSGVPLYIPVLLLAMLVWPFDAVYALDGVLRWNGGDKLAGTLEGADGTLVRWKSPRFPDAFYLDGSYLSAIEFETEAASRESNEPFRVTTTSGDVLLGELVGIDADRVRMQSARHGHVTLRREFVREIRQLRHTQVVYDGPRWMDGWTVLKAGRRESEWSATKHGYLHTETYGAELCHTLTELDVSEIHLVLRWSGKPGFQVDFSALGELVANVPRFRIRSLRDDLVAHTSLDSSDFRPILKLDARRKELRLRIVWNHQSGEIAIHDQFGRRLALLLAAKISGSPGFGILIKNSGEDLTIERVRVSRWNGVALTKERERGAAYLRLADGELVTDSLVSFDADQGLITVESPAGPRLIPIEKFAVAEFTSATARDLQSLHVRFHDGNELVGELAGIEDTEMTVNAPSATRPIRVKLDGVKEMRFMEGLVPAPAKTRFRIHFADGLQLQGQLAAASNQGALGWLAGGSQIAVPLPVAGSFTVDRKVEQAVDGSLEESNEMVFLRDGTALAARISTIDSDFLRCETSYAKQVRIPIQQMKAVELFRGSGRVSFASPNWEFLNETAPVHRSYESLEVVAPVSFRDLSLDHGGRLTLGVAWDEGFFGLLTIHLGTTSRQPLAQFTFRQDRVSARYMQKPIPYRKLPPVPERRATISLQAEGKTLSVWVNGNLAFETQHSTKVASRGVWIQSGSATGRLSRSPIGQSQLPGLVLAGLRVGQGAGVENLGFVDEDQKRILLQVPRSRKKYAPSHVLCAKNGDLLRGTLLGMEGETVQFRSRLSDISLPREQLAALIWLDMADDAPEEGAPLTNRPRISLYDGSVLFLDNTSFQRGWIRGDHPLLGECEFSIDSMVKFQDGDSHGWMSTDRFTDWTLVPAPEPQFATVTSDSSETQIETGIDSPLLGQQIDVAMSMLDGREFRLLEYRNQVVVLDFWATWCAPCIRSLPLLQETVANFPAGKVTLIAVNQEEAEETVQAFLKAKKWELSVALDRYGSLSERFQVESIPHTVIIGPQGRVERVFVGAPTGIHESIEKSIRQLLDDPTPLASEN